MRKTGQSVCSGTADVDEPEPDSNLGLASKVVRALDSGFAPSLSKQPSAPPTNLGIRALGSGRQIERETDLRKVFRLSTRTAVNSSSKRDLAAMAEADEPNGPADAAASPRKVACGVPSPPNSPPPLAPNASHDLASPASEQLQLRISGEHLLMLASGAHQRADTSATQVGTPSRSHSPSNLSADDALVDMAGADAGRKLDPAASSRASSSGYLTPGKLRLQLPGLSSAMLAVGPTDLSAETDLRNPLRCFSAH